MWATMEKLRMRSREVVIFGVLSGLTWKGEGQAAGYEPLARACPRAEIGVFQIVRA
jgi:hypothetical protein